MKLCGFKLEWQVAIYSVWFNPRVWKVCSYLCCFFTHLHCVICPAGLELQATLLSLHSLCYLSHRCGTTSSAAVSSLIVLFVPQAWNYEQHRCLITHCVICPTGLELQAASLSLHSLCFLSHRCETTSSIAISSLIVLFVPQVWNYKQRRCLFTHRVICPTGLELQAASLSLLSLCYLSHRCGTTSSVAVSSLICIVLFVPKVWNYKQRRCLFTLLGHLDYIRTTFFHHVSVHFNLCLSTLLL